MSNHLLDRAYALHKQGTEAHRAASVSQLQAEFAGIALPNAASVALHEALGFEHLGTYRNVGFKKDAWYLYRSFLRPHEPTVHLASKTYFLRRGKADDGVKKIDIDGDGRISRAEAQAGAPRLAKHFDEIDTNKDGFITPEEMKAAHQKRASEK